MGLREKEHCKPRFKKKHIQETFISRYFYTNIKWGGRYIVNDMRPENGFQESL